MCGPHSNKLFNTFGPDNTMSSTYSIVLLQLSAADLTALARLKLETKPAD